MEIQAITTYFVFGMIAVIGIFDSWAFFKGGTKGTISYLVITQWSRKYPALTFACGFVAGHLFWPLSTCG